MTGRRSVAAFLECKRDGGTWTGEELAWFMAGVRDGAVADAQLGAFAMAVCCRGMTARETADLTIAMRDSGTVLEWPESMHPVVDKHSTGGVGDKVSLVLAPLMAACGARMPMISGRGLGHTGGTIDKLEAIPGYRTDLDGAEIRRVVEQCGYAMASAGPEIAPADRRLYAVRDVSGTVASLPLITASILSKKLAAGLDGLVMDVKVGRGAFLTGREQAEELARGLVAVGAAAGLAVVAVLTGMDRVLGRAAGNALEVREVVACLQGGGPADLREVVLALGVEMCLLAGAQERGAARRQLEEALDGGAAWQRFLHNMELQGADPRAVAEPDGLATAPVQQEVVAEVSGFVRDLDPRLVGDVVVSLGGGRRAPGDAIDPAVGVEVLLGVGAGVSAGDPVLRVHGRSAGDTAAAVQVLESALVFGREPVAVASLVLGTVVADPSP